MSNVNYIKLLDVVRKLRDPKEGCPWDLEQTHQTLLPYLLEESYEFIEACEKGELSDMKDELGDVLLQVVLHSVIFEQEKSFTIEDVCLNLAEKLIRRHPHVFGDKKGELQTHEVIGQWEEIKEKEKSSKSAIRASVLNNPSLRSAAKIGKKTHKVGFDWDNPQQVLYKVEEEWQELKEELPPHGKYNRERVGEEIGDLLFSIAQLARHIDFDPEELLRMANKKFLKRFWHMEELIKEDGEELKEMSLSEKEHYWQKVKQSERN